MAETRGGGKAASALSRPTFPSHLPAKKPDGGTGGGGKEHMCARERKFSVDR